MTYPTPQPAKADRWNIACDTPGCASNSFHKLPSPTRLISRLTTDCVGVKSQPEEHQQPINKMAHPFFCTWRQFFLNKVVLDSQRHYEWKDVLLWFDLFETVTLCRSSMTSPCSLNHGTHGYLRPLTSKSPLLGRHF